MKRKRMRLVIAGAIFLAAAVALNALCALLPASVRRLDATQGSLITPSQALESAAQAVSQPVTIYYVSSEAGTDTLLSSLVQRAQQQNGLITVKRLVPGTAGDDIVTRYAPDGLSDNSLIVVGSQRAYVIANEDLIDVQYNQMMYYYYGQYVLESSDYYADSLLAFALSYTTSENLPTVYQLTGHGETALEGMAADELARRYVALESLDLSQADAVPADALVLVVNNPTADLTKEESDKLLSYLKEGGRLLLTTAYDRATLSNLSDVTAYYGLQAVSGLVQDPAAGRHYSDSSSAYNYYMKPIVQESDALHALVGEESLSLCVAQSHALTTGTISRAGLSVEPLLVTSEEAYLKASLEGVTTLDWEEGDQIDAFILAAAAREGDTRLAWIASGTVFSDNSIQLSGEGNTLLLAELLNWMEELPEKVEQEGVSLLLQSLEENNAAPVIKGLVIALPVFALIIGLLATKKRKA